MYVITYRSRLGDTPLSILLKRCAAYRWDSTKESPQGDNVSEDSGDEKSVGGGGDEGGERGEEEGDGESKTKGRGNGKKNSAGSSLHWLLAAELLVKSGEFFITNNAINQLSPIRSRISVRQTDNRFQHDFIQCFNPNLNWCAFSDIVFCFSCTHSDLTGDSKHNYLFQLTHCIIPITPGATWDISWRSPKGESQLSVFVTSISAPCSDEYSVAMRTILTR